MNRFPCGWWILPSCLLGLVLWFGIVGLVLADSFTIQWTEPTTREDGTVLTQDDIFIYGLYIDGSLVNHEYPGTTSKVIDVDITSPHIITMRTFDNNMRYSVMSRTLSALE